MRSLDTTADPNAESRVDPHLLRELGDESARAFVRENVPIADAVAKTLKKSGKTFNRHHVQRVVEYANLGAFRSMRQPEPGAIGRIVEFPEGPATTTGVLARMGIPGATEVKMGSNYVNPRPPPAATPTLSVKLAADQHRDGMELLLQLREAADQCRMRAAITQEKRAAAVSEICRHAEHALRQGATLGDVHTVLAAGAPDRPDMLKVAMDLVLTRVARRVGLEGEAGDQSMEKRSSHRANPAHPLALQMGLFVKLSDDLDTQNRAAQIVDEERQNLRRTLTAGG